MYDSAPFVRMAAGSCIRVRACRRVCACARARACGRSGGRRRRRAIGGGMRGVRGGAEEEEEEEEEEEMSGTARQRGAVCRSARPTALLALPPAWLPALARPREQALACRRRAGARARSFFRRFCCDRTHVPPRKTARPCRRASRVPRRGCPASAAGSCSPTWHPPKPSMPAPSCCYIVQTSFDFGRLVCPPSE